MTRRRTSIIPSRLPNGKKNPAYDAAQYLANREKELEHGKQYRREHPGYGKQYEDAHKEERRRQQRASTLKRKYNQTIDSWYELFLSQDCKCAICRKPLDVNRMQDVHTDHNHNTGKVRGILCNRCNRNVGVVESDLFPEYLAYIQRNR